MTVLKRKRNWKVTVVGDQRSGWAPVSTRAGVNGVVHDVLFDFEIQSDPGGYLLVYASLDGALYADTWHEALGAAEQAAFEQFGILPSSWGPGDAA